MDPDAVELYRLLEKENAERPRQVRRPVAKAETKTTSDTCPVVRRR